MVKRLCYGALALLQFLAIALYIMMDDLRRIVIGQEDTPFWAVLLGIALVMTASECIHTACKFNVYNVSEGRVLSKREYEAPRLLAFLHIMPAIRSQFYVHDTKRNRSGWVDVSPLVYASEAYHLDNDRQGARQFYYPPASIPSA